MLVTRNSLNSKKSRTLRLIRIKRLQGFSLVYLAWSTRYRGLNFAQLTIISGIHYSRLSRALNGILRLNERERRRIEGIPGVPQDWLFSEPTLPCEMSVAKWRERFAKRGQVSVEEKTGGKAAL